MNKSDIERLAVVETNQGNTERSVTALWDGHNAMVKQMSDNHLELMTEMKGVGTRVKTHSVVLKTLSGITLTGAIGIIVSFFKSTGPG